MIINNQPWMDRVRQLSAKIEQQPWMTTKNSLIYKNDRLYIPGYPDVKKLILEEFHQGPGGGHMGYKKTLAKVAKAYYWEKMPQSVQKFIQTCDICQRIKSSTQKPFGMLNP